MPGALQWGMKGVKGKNGIKGVKGMSLKTGS
jgi:hypothetical protein